MKRGGFSFKTAMKRRNDAYKLYVRAQKAADEARSMVQDWDDKCNNTRKIGDKWEPKFPRSINFSGYED
jgi:hypothetical protein